MRASVDVSDIQSQNPERRFQKWLNPTHHHPSASRSVEDGGRVRVDAGNYWALPGWLGDKPHTRTYKTKLCILLRTVSVRTMMCCTFYYYHTGFFFFFFTHRKDDLCVFNLLKFIRVIYSVQIIIWIAICKRNLWVKIKRPWAVNYSFFRYYCYHYWRVESLCIWLTE